jgi:plastocyanin
MTHYSISITSTGEVSPASLSCNPGDKIAWTNNYSEAITQFTLPSCVSPPSSPAPIAVGATTRDFTVNAGSHGTYDYSYGWPTPERAPRSGTIDVGSR